MEFEFFAVLLTYDHGLKESIVIALGEIRVKSSIDNILRSNIELSGSTFINDFDLNVIVN